MTLLLQEQVLTRHLANRKKRAVVLIEIEA